jgi:DNA-binding response OmpR family regulator
MHRFSVLLVEDNQLLRWWMTSSLQREGFRVVAPKSVEEAIALAATPFDVLITDWRLAQDHNGLEILTGARKKFPGTLAILISAEADAELSHRARAGGFDLVIEKPFAVADIVGAVQHLAERARPEVAS